MGRNRSFNSGRRNTILALFSSIAITTALYVLVAMAVVHMVSPAELAASDAPLTAAIHAVWPRLGNLLSAIALFATANTVLVTIIASSRLTFSMARDGEIHGMFAGLRYRRWFHPSARRSRFEDIANKFWRAGSPQARQ